MTIRILLENQRAHLLVDGKVAIDTPISTSNMAHPTPKGTFKSFEKKIYRESSLYGDYVDKKGRVVLAAVN